MGNQEKREYSISIFVLEIYEYIMMCAVALRQGFQSFLNGADSI